MINHKGREEGTLKASNIPVITAEPSVTVDKSPLSRYFCIAHSKKRQDATLTKVKSKALMPKKYILTSNAGNIAMTTPHIIFLVDIVL